MGDSIDSSADAYSTGMLSPPDWRAISAVPAECVREPLDMVGPRPIGGPPRPRKMPPRGPPEDGPPPGQPPPGGNCLPRDPPGDIHTSDAGRRRKNAAALASARGTPSPSPLN